MLGVTGGIAAYKTPELVRLLVKAGAQVQVVMTGSAAQFVTPMTLQALSGRPVRQALFDLQQESTIGHIDLARWADFLLVAPASAGFMARMAAGMADDLLTTLLLACEAPIAVAPAMNRAMWANAATVDNVSRLKTRGVGVWGPAEGDQACGEVGPGRMVEPESLFQRIAEVMGAGPLQGVNLLLTAGPTREAIDPVRFVGNRSSGKMGFALARAFASMGASVTLVAGPVSLSTPAGVSRVDVESALEMAAAVDEQVAGCDLFVACAAVADYRPQTAAPGKIKKKHETLSLEMIRNPDILSVVAARSNPPFTVGFAAETENVEVYAEQKRQSKGIDMIAANRVGGSRGGFECDENALTLLWEGGRQELPMRDKGTLAMAMVDTIAERYAERYTAQDS